jgi:hypothetical protein
MKLGLFTAIILCVAAATAAARDDGRLAQAKSPQVCPQIWQPVCGLKGGKRVTYSNVCFARAAGATDVSPGECPK